MGLVQAVRDWQRQRRRRRERLAELHAASVVFLSMGKSGRTWVRAMLSHLYHQRHGTPMDEIIAGTNFHAIDPSIPIIFFTHDIDEPPAVRRALDAKGMESRKFVHFVRDPRDVAVSRFYQFHFRASPERRRRRRRALAHLEESPLFDFVVDEKHGMPVVIASMNRWAAKRARLPAAMLMRYEDLHLDTVGQMRRLMSFLGEFPSDNEIMAAVEFARFEALKKREAEGFYKQSILRPASTDEPRSFKVRRGRVGGYKEDFSAEQVAILDRIVDDRLVDGLGYKTTELATSFVVPETRVVS